MKKTILQLFYAAALICAVSCAKDNDNTNVENGDATATAAVSFYRIGGLETIEIGLDDWTVVENDINEYGELPWCCAVGTSGSNGSVKIMVDYNNTMLSRSETLTFVDSNNNSVVVTVKQSELAEGEDALPNDDNIFLDIAKNKGLGSGFKIESSKFTTGSQIINTAAIKDRLSDDLLGCYNESTITGSELAVYGADSIVCKRDSLGVELNLSITFGKFSLAVSGGYSNSESVEFTYQDYAIGAEYPYADASYDVISLALMHTDDAPIFSTTFKYVYNQINSLLPATGEYTEDDLKTAAYWLSFLKNNYGPVIVSGSQLGGSVSIGYSSSELSIDDQLEITGSVTAGFDEMFELDIDATYNKTGEEILNKYAINSSVSGGELASINSINDILMSDSLFSKTDFNAALSTWSLGINEDNATLINASLTPIWYLFVANERASQAVEAYMKSIYYVDDASQEGAAMSVSPAYKYLFE